MAIGVDGIVLRGVGGDVGGDVGGSVSGAGVEAIVLRSVDDTVLVGSIGDMVGLQICFHITVYSDKGGNKYGNDTKIKINIKYELLLRISQESSAMTLNTEKT